MLDDNTKYRELFFEEADEHLESLNDDVLNLENEPDDISLIDNIFRSAHTLKGMAATMGFTTMTKLTHRMENIFQLFKNETLQVSADSISVIFECLDKLSDIINDLKLDLETDFESIKVLISKLDNIEGKSETTLDSVDEHIVTGKTKVFSLDMLSETDRVIINEAKSNHLNVYLVEVILEEECMLKGARVLLILDKLESTGELLFTSPSPDVLETGEFDRKFSLGVITQESIQVVRELVLDTSEIEDVKVIIIDTSIQNIPNKVSEQEVETEKVIVTDNESKLVKGKKKESTSHQSIRVDLQKLDSFMNLVSELVVYRTRLEELGKKIKSSEILEPLEHVARITFELQELVLKIRMQQVSVVMNRFPRVVRDLSKDLGKKMRLEIEGEDTELDRTVVSELSEPLIHLIRNSADHGIELAEERIKSGKEVEGLIKLTAYQQGNRVIITISDDGKGINPDVILSSAKKKGINTDNLSEKELLKLIFHPGFSTAQEVTNVSGRGVGMDVVHSKITSLGGSIELNSEVNIGTTFTINLPLTLSIIQSLMVKVGGHIFALPLGVIQKVIDIEKDEIINIHNKEVYMYNDEPIPVIKVNESLELYTKEINEQEHIIIVLLGKQYYALRVDNLIGQQEIVIKKLGKELNHLNKYLGATILGNGDIALILDINVLCQSSSEVNYV